MSPRHEPDAAALMRALRPRDDAFDPDAPAARERLERILATPPSPGTDRGRGRVALAAVAAAVLAAVGVALGPLVGGSPDVLARAAAALNQPDTILHFKALQNGRSIEVWQTAGARQKRVVYDGGELELVEDWDTKTSLAYDAKRDVVIRHTEPDIFDPAHRVPRGLDRPLPGAGAESVTDELARLLERARRGEDDIALLGEATVRGTPVYELRIDFTVEMMAVVTPDTTTDVGSLRTREVPASRLVYVDRERFLPVRVVERMPGVDEQVTEFLLAERLPRTPANERLLRMPPHPGAREVIEGRL
jgi:hypothetical protein